MGAARFIDILKSATVALVYAIANVVIGYENTSLFFLLMVIGSVGFFLFFSAAHSLAYTVMFLINPFHISGLSISAIIPFFLCFLYPILFWRPSVKLLKRDPYFRKLLVWIGLFTAYQVIVSYLLLSGQDLNYMFLEMTSWAAIWVVVPVYLVGYKHYKNLALTILFIVLLNILVYYLAIFDFIDLFDVVELNRYDDGMNSSRFLVYDLRQVTKIFVYLSPLFAVYYFRHKISWLILFAGGFVFLAVALAVLRTELFYLFMGMLLSIYLGRKYLGGKIGLIQISFFSIVMLWLAVYLFPNLLDTYEEVFANTLSVLENRAKDTSAEYRANVQLPVLLDIVYNNLFFGGGKYAISYEKTGHYLLFDIPILGAFGAYGIVGMIVYYVRYIFIFKRIKILSNLRQFYRSYPSEVLIIIGMFSYFISMLLFRTLHINIELAFEFGQVEFGLFIGLYFAMTRFLSEQNVETIKPLK